MAIRLQKICQLRGINEALTPLYLNHGEAGEDQQAGERVVVLGDPIEDLIRFIENLIEPPEAGERPQPTGSPQPDIRIRAETFSGSTASTLTGRA